ncbi:long-chain-fatty-acid--CoA ligase [Aeromicrobium marinum DSM 15272]|uniref:Long-chain-fatty-acid--CoA ligase n=1 Tax=Aeromicrobium marinum DSM 15272 TaxID=585531 RepID=E2S7Y3_9ACTN|nr:long-chain-fatty-acid--CoA ligase [Aeromicrobium marinum]EFQ84799.1 long-chain-fatty-acid--CoA ligase [Aeromicrobium marinum DSM 15272]
MSNHTLADVIRASAAAHPDSAAIVGEGRSVTYAELSDRSSAIAGGLVAWGLQPGDRVAYLARNATEYWELFFATAKAGLAVVPLNFRLSADEVTWILGDCEPAAILAEDHLTHLLPADWAGHKLVFNQTGEPEAPEGWEPFERWLAAQPVEDPKRDLGGDALACLMYSSGTTGRPKGVTTTVAGFLWAVDAFGAMFDVSPASVSLVPTPYYHIAAGGWSLIALAAGGTIVQFTEVTPANMLGLLVGHKATHVIMVPTVMQLFITSPEASAADYSSVEHVVYGGSPISETVMLGAQRVFGAQLSQSYGLTETIGVTTFLRPEDHVVGPDSKLRSAGRAVPGLEVAVMDPDTGETCAPGVVGEIVTRGPGVTKAYWRNPEATEQAFWPGGWFRTGDAGSMDEQGYVFLKDRIKDLLMSGGENIYPAEVENAIMAHPAVQEVAVIGVPSEKWGETPLAVVVPKQGESVDADELIAFTRERLAHFKCPTAVEVIEQLPRNPSGKVLKRELRAPFWAGHDRSIG